MKLCNKKTGEIGELTYQPDKEYHFAVCPEDPSDITIYKTLAHLNEEWEDYRQQAEQFYFIDDEGDVEEESTEWEASLECMKAIGNYFETKEEAEKAVEKLKAWKRLKDKGFKFEGWAGVCKKINFTIESFDKGDCLPRFLDVETANDLDLLFGGEE